MKQIEVIDGNLLDNLSTEAKIELRFRMNHNFHKSLDDKCHRFVNAIEPEAEIPIHHHPTKDETIVILRGRVKVMTFNDKGELDSFVILSHDSEYYGVNISMNVWHTVKALKPGTVVFECKEGPYLPHEVEGVLELKR